MPGERYLDQLRPQAKAAGILLAVVMVTGLGIYSTWLTSLDTQRSELRAEEALLAQVMPGLRSALRPLPRPKCLSITAGRITGKMSCWVLCGGPDPYPAAPSPWWWAWT